MVRKLILLGRDFSTKMKRKNISAFAASTAFFIFLSLVPMLIVLSTILPYTPLTEENLITAVGEVMPAMMVPLSESLICEVYEKSAGILPIALLTTLWSAGKGVLALMRGLNAINDVDEERNYFVVRVIASLYTVVLLAVTILSLFLMVFGNQLVDFIIYNIPRTARLFSFLMNFRFMLVWAVLILMFSAIYAYVPNKKLRFKEQLPGAAFSAVVWGIFSWGFSIYISNTQSYSIYGSLSIVVIAMIWMYMCMYIIMIGAYLNNYFQPVNRVLVGEKR